jgi:small subunit ribosomal protein S20
VANTKSSEKRARQSRTRQARNTLISGRVKAAVRAVRDAAAKGDAAATQAALNAAFHTLQSAASKGVLHARNAARRMARLSALVSKR